MALLRTGMLLPLLLLPACRRDVYAWRLEENGQVSRVLRRAEADLGPLHAELMAAHYDSTKTPRERKAAYRERQEAVERFITSTPPDRASQATAHAVKGWLLYLGGFHGESTSCFALARMAHPDVAWSHVFPAMTWLDRYGARDFYLRFSLPEERVPVPGPMRERSEKTDSSFGSWISFLSSAGEAGRRELWGWSGYILRPLFSRFRWDRSVTPHAIQQSLDMLLGLDEMAWFREPCLLARAKIRLFRGERDGALEDLGRLLHQAPKSAKAHRRIGFLHLLEALYTRDDPDRDLKEAMLAYRVALNVKPDHGEACYELGNVLLIQAVRVSSAGEGDPTALFMAAIEHNEKAGHFLPKDFRICAAQGHILHSLADWTGVQPEDRLGYYADAVVAYDKAQALEKGRADIPLNRGLCRLHLAGLIGLKSTEGRKLAGDAVADLQAALRLRGNPVWILSRLGEAYRQCGKGEKARGVDPMASYRKSLAVLDRALDRNPEHLRARLERGHTRVRVGLADHSRGADGRPALLMAIRDYRSALRTHPGDVNPCWALGRAYRVLAQVEKRHKGDPGPMYKEAVAFLLEAARLEPGDWPSLRDAGVILQRLGRHRKAAEVFEKALAVAGGEEPDLKQLLASARKAAGEGR
jgi:tetratricopeptide (TPR) repeat protein